MSFQQEPRPPGPAHPWATACLCELLYSTQLTEVQSHGVCPPFTQHLSITCSQFSCVAACVQTSFLFVAEHYSTAGTHYFMCPGISRCTLGCLPLWVPVNRSVCLDTLVYKYLCTSLFSTLWALHPGAGRLGHMAALCPTFSESPKHCAQPALGSDGRTVSPGCDCFPT